MLINGQIPSLVGGVSQQPPLLRLPSQAELQENAVSSVAEGLGKRNPTEHVAYLLDAADEWSKVHFIDRDANEKYVVIFTGARPKVFDLAGHEYTVKSKLFEYEYLKTDRAAFDIQCLTLADTTFVLNRNVTVELDGSVTSARSFEALVWVKAGDYSKTYTVTIEGVDFKFETKPDVPENIAPDNIARGLAKQMKALLDPDKWSVIHRPADNVIWVGRKNGKPFTIEASDTMANTGISAFTSTVQRFSDLPSIAPNGYVVKVIGEPTDTADDYWLTFKTNNPDEEIGPGIWQETVAPNIEKTFNPLTLPHLLVRKQDDSKGTDTGVPLSIYFEFVKGTWGDRNVGDEETNPTPSFVGEKINSIFFHRNRLGFIASTQIVMSRSGRFFDFWRGSVLTLNDDDPIDVSSSTNVTAIRHAKPFNEELLLFCDKKQMTLRGGDLLTPKTVSIVDSTEFEIDPVCEPIVAENLVYFPFLNGDNAGVREYFVNTNTNQKDSDIITSHVERYLPGSVIRMSASTSQTCLVAGTIQDRQSLYLYQWRWNGQEKMQSAWSRWGFGDETRVLGFEFIGTTLYIVIDRVCGIYLEKIQLPLRADPYVNYVTLLDRRITEAVTQVLYNAKKNTTRFKIPWRPRSLPTVVSRGSVDTTWKPAVVFPVIEMHDCDDTSHVPPGDGGGGDDGGDDGGGDPPDDTPPCVTIKATDPLAIEGMDTGAWLIERKGGDLTLPLKVRIAYGGTADFGADYAVTAFPQGQVAIDFLLFAANQTQFYVILEPVVDDETEGDETAILTLMPPEEGDPEYKIGCNDAPTSDTIIIRDGPRPPQECTPQPLDPNADVTIWFRAVNGPCEFPNPIPSYDNTWRATGVLDGPYTLHNSGENTWDELVTDILVQQVESDGSISSSDHVKINFSRDASGFYQITTSQGISGGVSCFETLPTIDVTCQEIPNRVTNCGLNYLPPPNETVSWTVGMMCGGFARVSQGDTPDDGCPDAGQPKSLTATSVSDSEIDLTWAWKAVSEKWLVQRSDTGTSGWVTIAQVDFPGNTFADTGLSPDTTYYYRIIGMNGTCPNFSDPSNVVSAKTGSVIIDPPPDDGGGGDDGNGDDDSLLMFNTGESRTIGQCTYLDANWLCDSVAAAMHYKVYAPAWIDSDEDSAWISYTPESDTIVESSDTVRQFTTNVKVGTGTDLSTLTVTGQFSCDDELVDITVNGVSSGVSLAPGSLWTSMHDFSLAGTLFTHGDNKVIFKVRNLGSGITPNPTGLKVTWNKTTKTKLSAQIARETAKSFPFKAFIRSRPVLGAAIAEEVAADEQDPCNCPHYITVHGDLRGKAVYIGMPYVMTYRFTPPILRNQTPSGGIAAALNGRLQLKTMTLGFSNTGYFRAEVTPWLRATSKFEYTARTVGVPVTRIGSVPNATGLMRFPLASKNDQVTIDLVNDSFLPSWLTSAEWEGFYTARAKRL